MNRTIEDSQVFLSVDQVARVLGVTRSWVYQHQHELPFTPSAPARGILRMDRADLRAYLLRDERDAECDPRAPKPLRSRLCRCPRPDRQVDADGVTYCGTCGELRPDDRDELIAFLVMKLDRLGREVETLTGR